MSLPAFRYHPDPLATGSVIRSGARCVGTLSRRARQGRLAGCVGVSLHPLRRTRRLPEWRLTAGLVRAAMPVRHETEESS